MTLPILFALALAQAPNGQALFDNNCTSCHNATPEGRTPSDASLRQRRPERATPLPTRTRGRRLRLDASVFPPAT